jgi:hypothetical protein
MCFAIIQNSTTSLRLADEGFGVCSPCFDGSSGMDDLGIEGRIEMVARLCRCRELIENVIDSAGTRKYSVCVMGGDSVCIEFVAFVTAELPDVEKVSPQDLNEFLGP